MRGAVLIGVLLLAGCGQKGGTGATRTDDKGIVSPAVSPKGIPEDWTHQELLAHLNQHGLRYKMFRTNSGAFFGPAVILASEGTPAAIDEKSADEAYREETADVVYSQVLKTPQEARDAAGMEAGKAFASGRFLFRGHPDQLRRVRAALP